ncbi:hypothetical protein E2C01_071051 [Portunus trituberculatus]|uniref:Uncharacterized protein n=1 Tax=Portunus trituberculatus TaxID=210409 RepID=A0A5B7I742_PORTR|nr:hypothetical protein [Portunus trituberculatus]
MGKNLRRVSYAPCSVAVYRGKMTTAVQEMDVSLKMSRPTTLFPLPRGHSGISCHLSVIETCTRYAWLLISMRLLYIHRLR